MNDGALPLPVNMIMFASNRSAWEPTPQWQHQSAIAQDPQY